MHVIKARNVAHALYQGLDYIHEHGENEPSRDGPVLVSPVPVTTVYARPTERVVFDEWRDANPFFHLFESIWMLAGQNDARWLDTWVRDFSSRYAEPGGLMWGTYGHRWRSHFEQDQLQDIVHRLRRNPRDRRIVLSMWDPSYDLVGPEDIDEDGVADWGAHPEPRDLPCNTHVYFRVRNEDPLLDGRDVMTENGQLEHQVLDMTVLCRSNDIVWGAYGANAVHFSVLQEYMAAAIGVGVGIYYQMSNNYHLYTERFAKMLPGWGGAPSYNPYLHLASGGSRVMPMRMVTQPQEFLRDCERFVFDPSWDQAIYANSWFSQVAVPMRQAHLAFKHGDVLTAQHIMDQIAASDWRLACQQWVSRHAK